jgi:hypothetical protein
MPEQSEPAGVYIDGKTYTMDDLTFREQREVRETARKLAYEGDIVNADEADFLVAFVYVVGKRTQSELTVDDVLEMKPSQLEAPSENGNSRRPPTERSSSSRRAKASDR